ncbi:unnamed protein product [Protopolystoma xenopodis]|uniref:Uncharacterized protein n=1 Tax=Protopolystoma xenopodis TaxID=117903 RepID=A0A448X1X1_9PLAT|nr:unnamed protein product [Protopolystoma xenopodis]
MIVFDLMTIQQHECDCLIFLLVFYSPQLIRLRPARATTNAIGRIELLTSSEQFATRQSSSISFATATVTSLPVIPQVIPVAGLSTATSSPSPSPASSPWRSPFGVIPSPLAAGCAAGQSGVPKLAGSTLGGLSATAAAPSASMPHGTTTLWIPEALTTSANPMCMRALPVLTSSNASTAATTIAASADDLSLTASASSLVGSSTISFDHVSSVACALDSEAEEALGDTERVGNSKKSHRARRIRDIKFTSSQDLANLPSNTRPRRVLRRRVSATSSPGVRGFSRWLRLRSAHTDGQSESTSPELRLPAVDISDVDQPDRPSTRSQSKLEKACHFDGQIGRYHAGPENETALAHLPTEDDSYSSIRLQRGGRILFVRESSLPRLVDGFNFADY